jgi:hypothetical protein
MTDMDNVDGLTIAEVLERFEGAGYRGQFRAVEGARLECLTCRQEVDAASVELDRLCRLEGTSDPDDMLAAAALHCPNCGALGTVLLNYGPEAPIDDAEVLVVLGGGGSATT